MTLLPVLYIPTIEREEEKNMTTIHSPVNLLSILEGQGICNIPHRIYDFVSDLFL